MKWTAAEIAMVRRMRQSGIAIRDIGQAMHRGDEWVRELVRELGFEIALSPLRWTAAEDARLRELYASGASNRAAAREIGRPWSSVANRACRLGLKRRPSDDDPPPPPDRQRLEQVYAGRRYEDDLRGIAERGRGGRIVGLSMAEANGSGCGCAAARCVWG